MEEINRRIFKNNKNFKNLDKTSRNIFLQKINIWNHNFDIYNLEHLSKILKKSETLSNIFEINQAIDLFQWCLNWTVDLDNLISAYNLVSINWDIKSSDFFLYHERFLEIQKTKKEILSSFNSNFWKNISKKQRKIINQKKQDLLKNLNSEELNINYQKKANFKSFSNIEELKKIMKFLKEKKAKKIASWFFHSDFYYINFLWKKFRLELDNDYKFQKNNITLIVDTNIKINQGRTSLQDIRSKNWPKDKFENMVKNLSNNQDFKLSKIDNILDIEKNFDYIDSKEKELKLKDDFEKYLFNYEKFEYNNSKYSFAKEIYKIWSNYFNDFINIIKIFYEKNKNDIKFLENESNVDKQKINPEVILSLKNKLANSDICNQNYTIQNISDRFLKKLLFDIKKREKNRPDTTPLFIDWIMVFDSFLENIFLQNQKIVILWDDWDIQTIFLIFINEILPRFFSKKMIEITKEKAENQNINFSKFLNNFLGKKKIDCEKDFIKDFRDFLNKLQNHFDCPKEDILFQIFSCWQNGNQKLIKVNIPKIVSEYLRWSNNLEFWGKNILEYSIEKWIPLTTAFDELTSDAKSIENKN